MRAAALLLALVVTAGCQSLEPLESIEPRAGEPVPLQIVKGIVYVPAVVLIGAGVVAIGLAQHRAYQVAIDEELGRPESEINRQIY